MTKNERYTYALCQLLLLVVVSLLWSCTADSESEDGDTDNALVPGRLMTRASGDADDDTQALRLFLATATGQESGRIAKLGDGTWRSAVRVKKDVQYYVYGYRPDVAASSTLTPVASGAANGAELYLRGVKAVTQDDLCVVVGVQDVASTSVPFDVQMGQFGYVGKDRGQNFVHLLLDHLLASARFQLLIDADYGLLRTIKVKKVEALTDMGENCNIRVTLLANTAGSNPISMVSYDPMAGTTAVTLFESEDGEALSALTPFTSEVNFIPTLKNNLSLRTTYDMYDSKGNYLQTRTAVNRVGTSMPTLLRGNQTTLQLTVRPTYLYLLSDPDLDNPEVVIHNS